jgi:hypothetical protein
LRRRLRWFKGTVKTGRGRILHLYRAQFNWIVVLNQSLHEGSQTVNCQPSFQPVPSSTPMSSSTPGNILWNQFVISNYSLRFLGVQSNCVFQEVFISGRFVINIVKQESIVSGQRITGAPRTQGTVYSQSVPPIKLASIPLLRCCPVDHYANFPNSVRKVTLMDSKGEKLHVQRTSPA